MSLNWERLSGSTDIFAVRLSFLDDPHGGQAVDAETALTWGAIQVWVEGQNLCAHVEQAETLSSAHWYLLPFLEWIADSWDPLLHEERLPVRNSGDDAADGLFLTRFAPPLADDRERLEWEEEWYQWYQRHALRAARDGGLFPNIYIRRYRDKVEVSWDDEPLAGTSLDFQFAATRGVARLYPNDVARPLYEVAQAAAGWLAGQAPNSVKLRSLTERLAELTLPSRDEHRLAWLAGLKGFRRTSTSTEETADANTSDASRAPLVQGGDRLWHLLTETIQSLGDVPAAQAALSAETTPLVVTGSCQAALLFGAVAPVVTEEDVRTLARILVEQYSEAVDLPPIWDSISAVTPESNEPAWQQGYALAEDLQEQIDLGDEWVDVEEFLGELGVRVLDRRLTDTRIRGVSLIGPQHLPTIVVNDSSIYGTSTGSLRFTLAHELCHLFFDRAQGQKLAVASGPWAPRDTERRANAFAAMLLIPPHLVKRAIEQTPDTPLTSIEGIRAIASRLRVSLRATIEHLYNLTLMDEAERDALLDQLRPG